MEWVIEHVEWIFSGIGATIIGGLLFASKRIKQVQKSGNNSTNIQVGENFTIGEKDSDE